jgi:hypothetical protein
MEVLDCRACGAALRICPRTSPLRNMLRKSFAKAFQFRFVAKQCSGGFYVNVGGMEQAGLVFALGLLGVAGVSNVAVPTA